MGYLCELFYLFHLDELFLILILPLGSPVVFVVSGVFWSGLALWVLSVFLLRGYVVFQMLHQIVIWVWSHAKVDVILHVVKTVYKLTRDIWGWLLWLTGYGKTSLMTKKVTAGGMESIGGNLQAARNITLNATKID